MSFSYKQKKNISNYLNINHVAYVPQYTFDDCKDIRKLPFDFYIPDYNACIEVNGRQHYKDIRFDGVTYTLDIIQEHDRRKKQYCVDNGIVLIEIPYWDISKNDTYKDTLNTFFSAKR